MGGDGWTLVIERGRQVGRVYPLGRGETVLGGAPGAPPAGLSLADQEGASPRRMAPRQAAVELSTAGLTVRDLESPGGTFVNRQRILPGQARPLAPGDLIQLGGVQLRVARNGQAPPPEATAETGALAIPLTLPGGTTCRTWDDVLTVSAQRWETLRDALNGGQVADWLRSLGRPDLIPPPGASGSPDERLDAWLGSLPTTRPSAPELDLHPTQLVVRAASSGGLTQRKLRVTNSGYRLLRANARVEPAGVAWLSLPEAYRREILVVEGADLPLEIAIPEGITTPLRAAIVVESNGGTRRVAVVLEPLGQPEGVPSGPSEAAATPLDLRAWIARQALPIRLATWPLAAGLARLSLAAADRLVPPPAGAVGPGLRGSVLVLAALGAGAGAWLSARRGGSKEVLFGGGAGAGAGVGAAALFVALARAIEVPPLAGSGPGAVLVWAALGALADGLSTWIVPARPGEN